MDSEGVATIERFYREHRQALFSYALSLTRHGASAEDAVHDAICRLLARPELPRELRPYTFRCVRNAAVDASRRHPKGDEGLLAVDGASDPDGFRLTLFRQVEAVLWELPTDEMEAVVLRLLADLSFREIAEMKDAPLSTVASWYRRGLARLRQRVNGDGPWTRSKTS